MTNEKERLLQATIRESAEELINALSMPIRGEPSVTVHNRENAVRFVSVAFRAIWDECNNTERNQ